MVVQGWLAPAKLPAGPGYALTKMAERRLRDAAARIYRSDLGSWDRRWHLLVVGHVSQRSTREKVRNALNYLGYAPLRDDTWISPRKSSEVDVLLDDAGVRAHRFTAEHQGDDTLLAADAWDLDAIGRAYARWLTEARAQVRDAGTELTDEGAFVVRSRLVHEWRKFLFKDPGLPKELLPEQWPGREAAEFFDREAQRLLPGADRYVDACLTSNGDFA
jgi:phenylacetic acid degradation operon negative regulatory protein